MQAAATGARPKPRLRGVVHLLAVLPAAVAATVLYSNTPEKTQTAVIVYGAALICLFGVSGIYHTPHWEPKTRAYLRRLDLSMIYLFIAGTYTPFCVQLGGSSLTVLLPLVWSGAVLGILKSLFWVNAPRYITAIPYVLLGWAVVPAVDDFYNILGAKMLVLLGAGGLMYTLGAVIYARKSPDPAPFTFGYHEIFHALVLAAAVCHYAAIWISIT